MKSVKSKIILMNVLILVVVALILGTISISKLKKSNSVSITQYETLLREDYDKNIRNQVENVISLLDGIYNKQVAGELTEVQAQEQAKNFVRNLRYNEEGYFFIDSLDGDLVVHPILKEKEGQSRLNDTDKDGNKMAQNEIKLAAEEAGGYQNLYFQKPNKEELSPKRVYCKLFKPYGWIVNTGNYVDNIDEQVAAKTAESHNVLVTNVIMILISMIILLIIAIIIAIKFASHLVKPLDGIKKLAQRFAKYDFTKDVDIGVNDEFGQTAKALNIAQNNIKDLIKIVVENSQNMSASSEELSATVEELSSNAIHINETIKNIADNMQETSAATEEVNASIQEVNSSINELSQKAMEGSNNAIVAKERSTQVKNNSQKAIEETKKISDEKQNNMIKLMEDGKIVENIKVMADTIASIAEQTNLLALNAAIEAARAGDHGKGFAVVADEVRMLAEQSSDEVKNIQETIVNVQGAFKNSLDTGSDMLEFLNKDVQTQFVEYEKTGNQYYNDSDFISKISEEIAAMSEEITATVGQVSEVVQSMAGTSQKSSEQTESIKEGINEATQALSQVALTAQSQSEIAEKLNETVQKFKI